MKGSLMESAACRAILMFFQESYELDGDSSKSLENGEGRRFMAPHEACNRIAEVVQEAVKKMEMVADEKMRLFKKARMALEACDCELENKAREVVELKLERQKKLQIEELEKIVRLKLVEADMFPHKANVAKRDAERMLRIVLAKSAKSEEEYTNRYLKLRLSETEAEKKYLLEQIKFQESSRASQSSAEGGDSLQLIYSKIQDLLQNMYSSAQT